MSAIANEAHSTARAIAPAPPRPAVSVHHASKTFRLPREQYHTLKERALHPFRARHFDALQAVRDVTLEIAPGEFFGIVGRNGSGKSTLLKCLAGIYRIDEGDIAVHGRLAPFIELGVGFNPDLTARDNVIINAIMLGLSRKQARLRFDDIIAFAELEDFVDLKLKNYSSGMYVRLAFATAVQVDADILLIDEVLAVGDANFQQKCFDEFTRLHKAGRTILFVTHDMGAVERFCDRAMLLDQGRVVDIAKPGPIARQYNQLNFGRFSQESGDSTSDSALQSLQVEVVNAVFQSRDGQLTVSANQGEPCFVRVQVHFATELVDPIFSLALLNENGQPVFVTSTDAQGIETGRFAAGTDASVQLRFDNWLAPGRYQLIASVARAGFGADVLHRHTSSSIIVLAAKAGGGMTDLPHSLAIERR